MREALAHFLQDAVLELLFGVGKNSVLQRGVECAALICPQRVERGFAAPLSAEVNDGPVLSVERRQRLVIGIEFKDRELANVRLFTSAFPRERCSPVHAMSSSYPKRRSPSLTRHRSQPAAA